jgi:DNA-binding phage protein
MYYLDKLHTFMYDMVIMINLVELRQQVLRHLEARKISVTSFAKEIGLQQPTLHRFLKGETIPTIENINKIILGLEKNKAA